nr:MAG TPA: hypothetical protein [Caudoviricetes sp.]
MLHFSFSANSKILIAISCIFFKSRILNFSFKKLSF